MESREAFDINLERYWFSLKRSWLFAAGAFFAVVLLAFAYSSRLKNTYEADAKLLYRIDKTSMLTGLDDQNQNQQPWDLRSLLVDQSPLNSEIEILTSRPLLQQTIDRLNLRNEEGEPLDPEDLESRLTVKMVGAADVIQVAYEDADPKTAAAVVNTLTELYVNEKALKSQSEALGARQFIAEQLPTTERNVREAETQLRRFREANGVVALTTEAETAVTSLGSLNDQITAAQAEYQKANARALALRQQTQIGLDESVLISAVNQSPAVQQVFTDLQEVERELATEQVRFNAGSPIVSRLKERQQSLRQLLRQKVREVSGRSVTLPDGLLQVGDLRLNLMKDALEAEVDRVALGKQLNSLVSSRSQYQQRLTGFPRLEQEQRELERKLEAAQSTYETLLTRLQELQVKERQANSNIQIIEPAVEPKEAAQGSRIMFLGLGVVGGAMLAIAIVILTDLQQAPHRRQLYATNLPAPVRNGQEPEEYPEKERV
ncbi:GumC family protein [Leptolyngbya ohadii]|uniref:GumC family protein n=1 Tax=Leptolyngbya ohadii TaxID=1962290 RepID=UPI000B5A05D6|nr:GumC family protein [Leptolyngbya ohadii]